MDRTRQVTYIRNLAGDISSAMPAEVKPTDAAEVVNWWLNEDDFPKLPAWWDNHDKNLLIKWVGEGLAS